MDFQDYLKTSACEIDYEIDSFFQKWSQEVLSYSSKLLNLNKSFIQANLGGKRLRGALVKLGYELAGGIPNPEILKPAAAYEVFQTAILAHDDIIDQSPTRRGKQTIYQALGGDHYAISQTICLGDGGLFMAMKLIASNSFPEDIKNRGLQSVIQTALDTVKGEMLDVALSQTEGECLESDALQIFRLKTAMYTITGPLQLGAIFGGGDEHLLKKLENFGMALGTAFQIQDDILGVFGDEKTLGKSVTSDIEEGKNTLLIIHALKNATPKQKQILDKYYGKGQVSVSGLEQIKKVFVDTGALEYSKKRALELIEEAKKVIGKMEISKEHQSLLFQMADFLVKRDK